MKEEKTEWSAIIGGIIFLSIAVVIIVAPFAVAIIVAPSYRSEPHIHHHHTQDEYCRGKNKDSSLRSSPFSRMFGIWGNLK
jgi:hypothetical protein